LFSRYLEPVGYSRDRQPTGRDRTEI